MKEQSLQRRKLAKKKLSMRNPERLLAQKALGAKLRRSESRILLEKISQDKQLYASIIHTRKQLARLETERASPKISRLRRKSEMKSRKVRPSTVVIRPRMNLGREKRSII